MIESISIAYKNTRPRVRSAAGEGAASTRSQVEVRLCECVLRSMAAGGVLSLGGAVVAALLLLAVAGGARADCFDFCFKNCIANDRSMADYCNYACGKTCQPGASLAAAAAAAGGSMRCQLSCVRASCGRLLAGGDDHAVDACYGQCYDGCKSTALPRPLRAGGGPAAPGPVPEFPASEPDPGPVTEFPASEPNPPPTPAV